MGNVVRQKIGFIICILFVITTILYGCSFETVKYIGADKRECEELLDCLSTDNIEDLKSMFCKIISSSEDFDEQIQRAMEFFEGTVISHDFPSISSDESVNYGKYKVFFISPVISNIVTSTDKIYEIEFYSYLAYAKDRNREGISELIIKCSDGTECIVGDYYKVSPEDR